jgi:hypothetical protein
VSQPIASSAESTAAASPSAAACAMAEPFDAADRWAFMPLHALAVEWRGERERDMIPGVRNF